VENGRQSQCTITCIGKIRLNGFLNTPDKAREDNPMDYLIHIAKIGKPLYPQFGLEPNVYYVPPIHVPPAYLTQMFGWGVEEATKTYRRAKDDTRLLAVLLLFGSTPDIIHRFKVDGRYAVGYDESGAEMVRVPLREPIVVRAVYDERHQAYRTNVT
jgi:nitrate reductase beta subunit